MDLSPKSVAEHIDQTLLSPTAGFAEGAAWIEHNAHFGFAALCVSPFLVPIAAQRLAGTLTKVCSVAAFPLGYAATESKAEEAAHLAELGCDEIDMVVNVGALLEGERAFVTDDIAAVVRAVDRAAPGRALVKVILETGRLTEDAIRLGCECAADAGAAFVKTSTGFGPRGASVEDVRIMHETIGGRLRIKAAGGIRDLETARAMLEAGADRIGTSSGERIMQEAGA